MAHINGWTQIAKITTCAKLQIFAKYLGLNGALSFCKKWWFVNAAPFVCFDFSFYYLIISDIVSRR
jgi:hypothetical protein